MKKASEITDDSVPRSFVFHRGDIGKILMQLITDMRHVMEPYTATNLKVGFVVTSNKNWLIKHTHNVPSNT